MATYTGSPNQNDTFAGADNVADTFRFAAADLNVQDIVAGGAGAVVDILQFTTAGTIASPALTNVSAIERIALANGANSLTLVNTLVGSAAGTLLVVNGGTGNDTVNASGVTTAGNRVDIGAGAGNDALTGGAGDDIFRFAVADLTSADTAAGGAGNDALALSGTGSVAAAALANVSAIEQITLGAGGIDLSIGNAVSLANAASLIISSGSGSDTVDASGITSATRRIDVTAGTGNDTFTGGAGADIFRFAAAALTASDAVAGGAGASIDILQLAAPGTATLANVTGIERIALANGVNALMLTDANVGTANGRFLVVNGNAGNDIVNASSVATAANRVDLGAGAGNDRLTGGAGNDLIRFFAADLTSADLLAGGVGTDALLLTGTGTLAADALNNMSGMEQISLGTGGIGLTLRNAVALANAASLLIASGSGSDTVNASQITSTARRIDVTAGAGIDALTGGAGADVFQFSAADLTSSDTVAGGSGGSLDILKFATAGTIAAAALANVSGIERIILANGTNALTLTGALVGSANGASLIVNGGSGADTVDASGLAAANRADLSAGAGNDRFTGGAGNDLFRFLAADLTSVDIAAGGAGSDTLVLTGPGTVTAAALAKVSGMEQITLGTGGVNLSIDTSVLVANVPALTIVSGAGSDTVDASGNTSATRRIDVVAGAGNDTFTGGAGADMFLFAAADLTSADTVAGGAGTPIDVLQFSTAGTVAAAALANVSGVERIVLANGGNSLTLTDALIGAITGTLLSVGGGTGNDTVNASGVTTAANRVDARGGAGNDTLNGGAGNDTLNGEDANDTLNGAGGNDELTGGAGMDTVNGNAGDDTLWIKFGNEAVAGEIYNGGPDTDTLKGALTIAANLSSATLSNLESITGFGGGVTLTAGQLDLFDTIDTGPITLSGAGVVDISDADVLTRFFNLSAAGNSLTLESGLANRTVNGGAAADTVTIVTGGFSTALYGGGGDDTLTGGYVMDGGDGGDTLTGGAAQYVGYTGGPTQYGGNGDDTLTGSLGDNTLFGGGDNDTMTGGAGRDFFGYTSSEPAAVDTITDFNELDGGGEEGDAIMFFNIGDGNNFQYLGDGAFTNTPGNTEARVSGNQVLVDLQGDAVADIVITLEGLTSAAQLNASDFFFRDLV